MSTKTVEGSLLALQAMQAAFLLLHDWVPLGRLSNLPAVQSVDSRRRLILSTLLSAAPWVLGLAFCCAFWTAPRWPHWVISYLWISDSILLAGALRAWWIPYLLHPEPERAARYKVRFAGTWKFLPERNGIAPDTLHVLFHATIVLALVLLAMR